MMTQVKSLYTSLCVPGRAQSGFIMYFPLCSDYGVSSTILIRQWPRLQLARPGYPDRDTYALAGIIMTSFGGELKTRGGYKDVQ